MRRILAAVLTIVVVGALSACGNSARDSEGNVTATASAKSLDITVGDCLGDLANTSIENVQLIPCADAHYWEAYATMDLEGSTIPAESEITTKADEFCVNEFETFVGIAADSSMYAWSYLYPSEETWDTGDREITCLVGLDSGDVKGSLKGAKQ